VIAMGQDPDLGVMAQLIGRAPKFFNPLLYLIK
jgi:hypothetical protein